MLLDLTAVMNLSVVVGILGLLYVEARRTPPLHAARAQRPVRLFRVRTWRRIVRQMHTEHGR